MKTNDSESFIVIFYSLPCPRPHPTWSHSYLPPNKTTMTLSKNNSAGSSSTVHKKPLVNKEVTLPSSGRKPGYFNKDDIDELTDISTGDIMFTFGNEFVELYGVEKECRELYRKEKEQIKKENSWKAIKKLLQEQEDSKGKEETNKKSTVTLEELLLE